jgi:hypothetical protein
MDEERKNSRIIGCLIFKENYGKYGRPEER